MAKSSVKASRSVSKKECGSKAATDGKSFMRSSIVPTIVSATLLVFCAICIGTWEQFQTKDDFPMVFFYSSEYEYVREHPESLYNRERPGVSDFDPELLRVSQASTVIQKVASANPLKDHLWTKPCTINRLSTPLHSFDDFLRTNGTLPTIFSSSTGIVPGSSNFRVRVEDVVSNAEEVISCLCNPDSGTNFGDSLVDRRDMSGRYCLWQFGLLVPFVLEHQGGMSNKEVADKLRFQCRLTKSNEKTPLVNRVIGKELKQSERKHARSFWKSLLKLPMQEDENIVWISSEDTRTPLHSDDNRQVLIQLRGTKHVTIVSDSAFADDAHDDAWNHSGPFDCSKYSGCSTNGLTQQECLLQEGEILWLPKSISHDVYSLQPSLTMTLRFD